MVTCDFRVRAIIRQVCAGMGVTIINGALDHGHMVVEIPPPGRRLRAPGQGHASRKIRQEFEHIRKRCRGQRFRQCGCFSTISGTITDDVIMRCPDRHTRKHDFSPSP